MSWLIMSDKDHVLLNISVYKCVMYDLGNYSVYLYFECDCESNIYSSIIITQWGKSLFCYQALNRVEEFSKIKKVTLNVCECLSTNVHVKYKTVYDIHSDCVGVMTKACPTIGWLPQSNAVGVRKKSKNGLKCNPIILY